MISDSATRTVVVEGVAVRIAEFGDPSSAQPLLVVNGIGAGLEIWGRFPHALSRGRRVIAFDAPGSGGSAALARPVRMPELARFVVALLDVLHQPEVDVLGYSWGGALAQQLAVTSPRSVRRLVLVSTTPGLGGRLPTFPARVALTTPAFLLSERYARTVAAIVYGGGPSATRTRDAVVTHLHQRRRPYGYACQAYAIATWSSVAWLGRIAAPTLVIAGGRDPLVPVATARLLSRRIHNAELVVQPDAGHLWLLEQPDAAAGIVEMFLRRAEA